MIRDAFAADAILQNQRRTNKSFVLHDSCMKLWTKRDPFRPITIEREVSVGEFAVSSASKNQFKKGPHSNERRPKRMSVGFKMFFSPRIDLPTESLSERPNTGR